MTFLTSNLSSLFLFSQVEEKSTVFSKNNKQAQKFQMRMFADTDEYRTLALPQTKFFLEKVY